MPASSASSPPDSALLPAPDWPLRLALVEDDATIRELLHRYLSACPEFDCIGVADSIETLRRELALSRPPQLLLLDLSLPGESSLAALPTLLAEFPGLQVLVQAAHDAPDILFQAMRLGACGFVVQSVTPLPYRQALLDVAADVAVMSPSVARKMLEYFAAVNPQKVPWPSYHERQVLDSLVTGHTEKQVAEQLHSSCPVVSEPS